MTPASSPGARMARATFALTALLVAAGVAIQVGVAADAHGGHFATAPARIANVFCYFTIQSNLLVGLGCLLLAIKLERTSAAFAWLRMTGLVAIAITGLVYWTMLADFSLHGWRLIADLVVHLIVPILTVVEWFWFGPRGLTAPRLVTLTIVYPACWLAFTLVRGPLADFYPYPFVDVDAHGYPVVLLNSAVIGGLVLLLAAIALWIDGRLAHRQRQQSAGPVREAGDAPSDSIRERLGRLADWRDRFLAAGPDERPQLLLAFGLSAADIDRVRPNASESQGRDLAASPPASASPPSGHDRIYELCALVGSCIANATYDEEGIVAWLRAPNAHLDKRCPLDALGDGEFDLVRDAWERDAELVAASDDELFSLPPRTER